MVKASESWGHAPRRSIGERNGKGLKDSLASNSGLTPTHSEIFLSYEQNKFNTKWTTAYNIPFQVGRLDHTPYFLPQFELHPLNP